MTQGHMSPLNTYNPNQILNLFGTIPVAQKQCYAAIRADYGINTRIMTPVVANGGAVTSDEVRVKLSTSTASNGSAKFTSINRLRYLNSFGGQVDFTAVFGSPKANSRQLIGLGDAEDGFFYGYDGLRFGVCRRRAGVDYWEYQENWNGDSNIEFSPQLGNIYRIDFQYLGFGFIVAFVVNPRAFRETEVIPYNVQHTIEYPNSSIVTHILNPTLPLYAEVTNTGNTSDVVLYTPSMAASLQGGPEHPHPLDIYNSADAVATFADTNNNHVLSVRNASTFNTLENRMPMELARLTITRPVTGSTFSRVLIYKNGATAGALTYADVDMGNSPAQSSATATTVTATNPQLAYVVASDSINIEFRHGEFVLEPGEWVTVGCQNSGNQSTVIAVTLTWVEQF